MKIDTLIIGQGIAGSVLAYTLHQRGQQVVVVADERPTASAVAAGLFNPVTGRKLVKTWKADVLFPFLIDFYQSIENQLDVHFLHLRRIYRPFRNIAEQNQFTAATADPELVAYLTTEVNHESYSQFIHNELGGIETLQAGWLDTQLFLDKVRTYFKEKNIFRAETFDYQHLYVEDFGIRWKDIEASNIVFCEGDAGRSNPYFKWLPFRPMKGEILQIKTDLNSVQNIVNQGVWMVPQFDETIKVGATYDGQDTSWQPTNKGEVYLKEHLEKLIKVGFSVENHFAGIRAATPDRRPFIGLHPEQPALGVFNGLGSKGISLAPFLASQFADFLMYQKELEPLVNIERYFSLYFK